MPTQAELITSFRKEVEDLFNILVKEVFKVQYGSASVTEPSTSVSFTDADITYADTDYEIYIYSALDTNNVDIKNSLTFTKTVGGFTIYAPRNCTVRWQTSLRTPYISYFTT